MEIEFYLLMALIGALGFCIGSFVAPVNKHLKDHIRFIEGKMGRYKQELQGSKKSEDIDFESLMDGDLSSGKIIKLWPQVQQFLKSEQGQNLVKQVKTGQGQTKELAAPDGVTWQ